MFVVYCYEEDGFQVTCVTTDHTCQIPEERALVGFLSSDPNPIRPSEIGLKTYGLSAPDRVAGSLAITRALGDGYLKRKDISLPTFKQHLPYISNVPTIYHRVIHDSDIAIVLASDGLWNYVTSRECFQILRSSYQQSQTTHKVNDRNDVLNRNALLRLKNLDQALASHNLLQDDRVHLQTVIGWDSHSPRQPFDQSLDALRNSLNMFPELYHFVSPGSSTNRALTRIGCSRSYPPPFTPRNEPTFQFTVKNIFEVTPSARSLAYLRSLYEAKPSFLSSGLQAKHSPPTTPTSRSSTSDFSSDKMIEEDHKVDVHEGECQILSTSRASSRSLLPSAPGDVKHPIGIAELPRRTAAVAALQAISSSTSSHSRGIGPTLDLGSRPHHRVANTENICKEKYRVASEKLLKQSLLNAARRGGIDITSTSCDFSFQSHRWKQRRDVIDDITVMVIPLQSDDYF